ncbi:MAG TPA: DUF4129 domain-containing protein [Candidatus Eremiobacteraceae bacterium]|nr:DUF4129 domain-containing protein [Candidatus Eremiobacteraceae bacterium]
MFRSRPLVAGVLLAAFTTFGALPALADPFTASLAAAAASLERAAKQRAVDVPSVHVAPAPLGGPPRYSPSVDDWLQANLIAARAERAKKVRAADLRAIATTLRSMAAGGGSLARTPRAGVDQAIAAILAQPAFRASASKPAPNPQESLWAKIIQWIIEQLGRLFDSLARVAQGAPVVGKIFAAVIIGLALFGLIYVAYRIARGITFRSRREVVEPGEPLDAPLRADELHAAAIRAARDGDFALAVTLLFRASLLLFDQARKIEYDPSRTAGEYRRLVRRRAPASARGFDALAVRFTLAAFAQVPVGEAEWDAAQAGYGDIEPAVAVR